MGGEQKGWAGGGGIGVGWGGSRQARIVWNKKGSQVTTVQHMLFG
jgi:hypothetical protein